MPDLLQLTAAAGGAVHAGRRDGVVGVVEHRRDHLLGAAPARLRELGKTVLVEEQDENAIRAAE